MAPTASLRQRSKPNPKRNPSRQENANIIGSMENAHAFSRTNHVRTTIIGTLPSTLNRRARANVTATKPKARAKAMVQKGKAKTKTKESETHPRESTLVGLVLHLMDHLRGNALANPPIACGRTPHYAAIGQTDTVLKVSNAIGIIIQYAANSSVADVRTVTSADMSMYICKSHHARLEHRGVRMELLLADQSPREPKAKLKQQPSLNQRLRRRPKQRRRQHQEAHAS